MYTFADLFALVKQLDKPVTLVVNETYVDNRNTITVKRVRCPGNPEGVADVNREIENMIPVRFSLDDLMAAVAANGWGYTKPRQKGAGFEYLYYLQPVSKDDLGIAAEVALFGVDAGWMEQRKETRHQRRFDGYMMRKLVLS